jgi:hypothetical protein
VACLDGSGLFFTVYPLVGKKAFVRRQSHGVGTMISLSMKHTFFGAYVGDVNTQEIFGFRPGSDKVHRVSEFDDNETLTVHNQFLNERSVLLRDSETKYSLLSRRLIHIFKNFLIDGGSIGTWLARLWKGEVEAVIIPPSMETPWDSNPVHAISLALGFAFFRPNYEGNAWLRYTPLPITDLTRRSHDTLIIHESHIRELTITT